MRLSLFYKFILLCICGGVAIFVTGNVHSAVDPYPSIEIPIFPGSYQTRAVFCQPKGTKSLNYFVRIPYPAREVLEFYDGKLRQVGYVVSLSKHKRQWESFIDDTLEGGKRVRQLLASWINPALKSEAFLVLRYVEINKKWTNELHVLCQIQPLIDTTQMEDFFERLSKLGRFEEFMKLLDSYRMSNGNVDIDKAIYENPGNNNLKEYKKIIDEIDNRTKKGGK